MRVSEQAFRPEHLRVEIDKVDEGKESGNARGPGNGHTGHEAKGLHQAQHEHDRRPDAWVEQRLPDEEARQHKHKHDEQCGERVDGSDMPARHTRAGPHVEPIVADSAASTRVTL